MSVARDSDMIDALNEVLNEVLDVVQDVKQAHRKVSEPGPLHAELDRLFEDLARWAQLLVTQDEALGVSPLSRVPSAAGRMPANLWTGVPTDDEVCAVVAGHLDRLGEQLAAALAEAPDGSSRAVLATIQSGLASHLHELRP